ncbi:hypothetical protein SAMD00019534_109080, partial [Acytostelium subglobosum LB1]|uniref:hypothetical protein n=1 Tax=Acytostelium subglobosum LB1 TaxID=1410327 RepID=UPI000644E427
MSYNNNNNNYNGYNNYPPQQQGMPPQQQPQQRMPPQQQQGMPPMQMPMAPPPQGTTRVVNSQVTYSTVNTDYDTGRSRLKVLPGIFRSSRSHGPSPTVVNYSVAPPMVVQAPPQVYVQQPVYQTPVYTQVQTSVPVYYPQPAYYQAGPPQYYYH